MDDAKIDALAREVMVSLRKAREGSSTSGHAAPASAQPQSHADAPPALHPSLRLLSVVGGVVGSPCIIEPDKPCIGSLKCRTFGH